MTHRSLFASGVLALALALPVAASAQHGGKIEVPEVPANLTVDEGNVPYLQTRAYGTQNYICLPNATGGVAWKLFGPQATLYPGNVPFADRDALPEPESGGAGHAACDLAAFARWQRRVGKGDSAVDGSELRRARRDSVAAAREGRHRSRARSAARCWRRPTFIHRVNTQGGIAPATGCTTAAQLGAIALVPYSTDYFFYRAEK